MGELGAALGPGEDPGRGPDSTRDPSLSPTLRTSLRLRTPWVRALLAPLRAPAWATGRISSGQLSPTALPCTPRSCPSRVRRSLPESGDKAEPRGFGPAPPWPHSPPRGWSPWAPPSRWSRTRGRPRLRARLLRGPCATAPRSRLYSAPLSSGSPRHRGGHRLFLLRPPLRPAPDVRRGGSSGGRGRAPKASPGGAATRRPRSALGGSAHVPAPAQQPSAPRRGVADAPSRLEVGGGGSPGIVRGKRTHPAFPKCLPRPTAGWMAGLGKGASGRVSERERHRGNLLLHWADQSGPPFGPSAHWPLQSDCTGLSSQEDPCLQTHCLALALRSTSTGSTQRPLASFR